jgi:hypothetical protein
MIDRNCRAVALTVLVCMALTLVAVTAAPAQEDPRLLIRAADEGHTLADGAGEPFFWLGDTGWTLLTSLWPEEAEVYLEDRRQKGFNVVQCILASGSGEPDANYDGERPWLDGDPSTPNSAYFDHVEVVRQLAAEKGMILALLPSWGWYVTEGQVINKENAFLYGNWLGVRFADATNVVWVLGGDRPAAGYEDVFRLLAEGIVAGDGGAHLMTYHPRGGGHTSAEWFADDDWIDMHRITATCWPTTRAHPRSRVWSASPGMRISSTACAARDRALTTTTCARLPGTQRFPARRGTLTEPTASSSSRARESRPATTRP